MSLVTKRFITSARIGEGLYSSKSKKVIREYLEKKALYDWAESTTGVDDKGAVEAEVTGKGHAGGTVPTEPFHLNVIVKDKEGKIIQTTNPHANDSELTNVWHAYLADSKEDLKVKAVAWKESQDSTST